MHTKHNFPESTVDYARIVGRCREGIAVLKGGQIAYANDAFCAMAGREHHALLGQRFFSLVDAQDQSKAESGYLDICAGKTPAEPWEMQLPGPADPTWVEMDMSLLESVPVPLVLVSLLDTTAKREALHEVTRLNDRLESILHSMHDVVVSFSAADRRILAINPAAEQLFGIPLRTLAKAREDDLLGFVHPDDREVVQAFYRDLSSEEYGELEYRIVRANRKVRWVRDEGYIVYCRKRDVQRMDHVIRDITEEKKAVEALHRSEQKYRDFFHGTKDMAFCLTPDGIFLDINDAGIELLGFSGKEEALRSEVNRFFELDSTRAEILAELNEQGFVANKHVRLRAISGASLELDVTARAKTDDAGYLLYYEGIATNITQAMEDQRNRVLRNAAGGMCHYLNTHLMQIMNAQAGMEEELDEIDEELLKAATAEDKDAAWADGRDVVRSYSRDIGRACRKVSDVTRAFNSAFLTYREEKYLDKAILDIFNAPSSATAG
ncbi:MAG: PAS domain S-box protein [Desulfovibrionales bacterium]|nr:PAS domain S-box protein [Desulfovibrionales bacterium]